MTRVALLYCCYAAENQEQYRILEKHLAVFSARQKAIALWEAGRISPGEDVSARIRAESAQASAIVLLITPDLLASPSCWEVIEEALRRRQRLFPVLLYPADWQHTELGSLAVLPSDGKPVSQWGDRDAAWLSVVRGLREALAEKPSAEGAAVPALPPSLNCVGRHVEVDALVSGLLEGGAPTIVLGGPGMGKTTLTVAALHDDRVRKRFRERRYFVRCDGCPGREALVLETARVLGLEPGPQCEARITRELAAGPAVLVLDNAETTWEADAAGLGQWLEVLSGVAGLSLVATIRGEERPLGPVWREPLRVKPLALDAAREVFLAVAGAEHRSDAYLDRLVEAVERVPLALVLLGHLAQGEPGLEDTWDLWREQRTALLRYSTGVDRMTDMGLSLELSIDGPRMTLDARRLLSLLGVLPDGIAWADLEAVMPGSRRGAARTLRRVGLAYDEAERLRVLAPIREHAKLRHPPAEADLMCAIHFYLRQAETLGNRVGWDGGADAAKILSKQGANYDAMIRQGLLRSETRASAVDATRALGEFSRFTGLGSGVCELLRLAASAASAEGDKLREAWCIFKLGDNLFSASDYNRAERYYRQALPVFASIGFLIGEAKCVQRLGDVTFERSELDESERLNQEALKLCRRSSDVMGEANCILGLGEISLQRRSYEDAEQAFQQALPLFTRLEDGLGQAYCLRGLAKIALNQLRFDVAERYQREAIALSQQIGIAGGTANSFAGLAEIALARLDLENVSYFYQQSLLLYRQLGELKGEARCLRGLGDAAVCRADSDEARRQYLAAIALFKRVQDGNGVGQTLMHLARITAPLADRRDLVLQAESAWLRINRKDLVSLLRQEFAEFFREGE